MLGALRCAQSESGCSENQSIVDSISCRMSETPRWTVFVGGGEGSGGAESPKAAFLSCFQERRSRTTKINSHNKLSWPDSHRSLNLIWGAIKVRSSMKISSETTSNSRSRAVMMWKSFEWHFISRVAFFAVSISLHWHHKSHNNCIKFLSLSKALLQPRHQSPSSTFRRRITTPTLTTSRANVNSKFK